MYRSASLWMNAANILVRNISTASCNCQSLVPASTTSYIKLFDKVKEIQSSSERERFAIVLKEFMHKEKYRRGHVALIDGALERMEHFDLEKDLLTYNRLLDIIPKNRYRSRTLFEALWPKPIPQIDLALRVLQKMEDNGVRPDDVTYTLLCQVFGRTSFPVQKCVRLAIAFDKYENIDPYRIREFPSHQWDIAKLALERMAGEGCRIDEVMVPTSMDDPFILGATNSEQRTRLESMNNTNTDTIPVPNDETQSITTTNCTRFLHVEGPHRLWLQKAPVFYYTLRISDQSDNTGFYLGLCMCRPPNQDSLMKWMDYIQEEYPVLSDMTVVYDVVIVKDTKDWNDLARLKDGSSANDVQDANKSY